MSRFAGMTGNERLFEAGVMDAWDTALRARDRDKMIEVLKIAEWSDAEAAETTDFILADPTKYEV
jgi:hypothetical protein